MPAVQTKIKRALEGICNDLSGYKNLREFFCDFLRVYGLSQDMTIFSHRGTKGNSISYDGDVFVHQALNFKLVGADIDLSSSLSSLINYEAGFTNKTRFAFVANYKKLMACDVFTNEFLCIDIQSLASRYDFFLPLAAVQPKQSTCAVQLKEPAFAEHPADICAAEKMGRLFDLIKQCNDFTTSEDIHALNVFLTRLLFCFYAEDTGLFAKNQFTNAISSFTQKDACDMSAFFTRLFYVLNQPEGSNARDVLPTHYTDFPYVNGGLFAKESAVPEFSAIARELLLDCATLDWSQINPDIFGSMFQAVIDAKQRGNLGQHYTSVPNIMRVIQPLFLNNLNEALSKAKGNASKLQALLMRLSRIRAFDVTAGSGNFLIIAYKELRLFEMRVIDALNELQPQIYFSGISLDQFFGIEIDDFAAELAVLSLRIAEHQMNVLFKEKLGNASAPLPLGKAGNIVCANSLRVDWRQICPKVDSQGQPYEVYILGNPPFLGEASRSPEQNADMDHVLAGFKSKRQVDFIAAFFWKGAQYIQDGGALAFVSTNSICQGVQVDTLWKPIFELGVEIDFAYQSFPWSNNAKKQAAVHVVIIGLNANPRQKVIYKPTRNNIHQSVVKNISPYLTEGGNLAVTPISKPVFDVSAMHLGSTPKDGGHLLLSFEEKADLIAQHPSMARWIKQYMGASEFLKNTLRYCLWLVDATTDDLAALPPYVKDRLDKVRAMRLASKSANTRNHAATPHLFIDYRLLPASGNCVLIPRVTSARRDYVPIGFITSDIVASDRVYTMPNATFYEFGVLMSVMHNVWLAAVCCRMKSDYSYSNTIAYNTFVWADVSDTQKEAVAQQARDIALIRDKYLKAGESLAGLYDPDFMPECLLAAHKALDLAVDKLYRAKPFRGNTERLEYLFDRYENLIIKRA